MKEEGRDVAVCSKRFHTVGFIPCCLLWFDLQIHSAVQQVGFRRFKRGYKSLQAPIDPAAAIAAAAKEHKDPTDPYFAYQWYLVSELTMVFLPYIIGCQETQTVQVQHKSVVGQIQSPSVTQYWGREKIPTKKRFRSVKRGQEGKKMERNKTEERTTLMKLGVVVAHPNPKGGRRRCFWVFSSIYCWCHCCHHCYCCYRIRYNKQFRPLFYSFSCCYWSKKTTPSLR